MGIIAAAIAALCAPLLAMANPNAASAAPARAAVAPAVAPHATAYPNGVFDLDEPSDLAPPTGTALPGYTRVYTNDFTTSLSTSQWFYFKGVPKGDPSGRFDRAHVAITKGLLKIGTWRDPRFGNAWVSGGVGLSGLPTTYGAYFVRSRETAPGPDTTELLWPQDNQWPPEIDFDEAGGSSTQQWWFVHYDNAQDQAAGTTTINILHWHTWGVIWTPSSITFTVDGREWGEVTNTSEIPTIPMTLDLQSQSWCGIKGEPCPTKDSTLLVDWVAVYQPT